MVNAGTVAVVGAGRLGTALGRCLLGAAGPFGRGFDGGDYEVVLLAVPDREIAAAAGTIEVRQGRIVGHCSGATPIDVMTPHDRFGLHPLMTVMAGAGPHVFDGAPAAIAGSNERALDTARALAAQLGMRPFEIDEADRAAYHAAASIACNFLVTLEDAAEVLLGSIGRDRSILLPILRATLDNWSASGRAALTGPVARGDVETVARQRSAVEQRAPELVGLFDALAARTAEIATRPSARLTTVKRAIAAIDAANADDPNRVGGEPLALAQGRLAHEWVLRLDPSASDALVLAARAHHLRRWVVPRSSYPEGRPGYLQWRRDQKQRHATELREILDAHGIDAAIAERATVIVRKIGLGSDAEVQTFEDAVCLTFLQTQLAPTVDKVDDDEHMVDVVVKTLGKMSAAGRSAALGVDLDGRGAELVARAVERFSAR